MTAKNVSNIRAPFMNTTKMNDNDVKPHDLDQSGVATHAIVKESLVEIEFRMIKGERFLRVKVFSLVRKGLFKYSDIRCAGNSRSDMQKKCGMLGGVLAEQLIEEYRDLVEPSHCAKMAGKHFDELCRVMEQQASQEASVS